MNSTSRASPVSSSRAPSDEAQGKYLVVNAQNIAHNARVNTHIFIFLSIVSGISCGILGLTGVQGFVAHLACMLIAAGTIATVKCERRVALYFPSLDKVLIDGPNAGFGTFVLFWTLSYNCCHLY